MQNCQIKKILKIENVEEQNRFSGEIQEIIKNDNEPDLTLFMSHPETKTIEIPFVKNNKADLPKIKLTYFNTTTKKMRTFLYMILSSILKGLALNGIKMVLD